MTKVQDLLYEFTPLLTHILSFAPICFCLFLNLKNNPYWTIIKEWSNCCNRLLWLPPAFLNGFMQKNRLRKTKQYFFSITKKVVDQKNDLNKPYWGQTFDVQLFFKDLYSQMDLYFLCILKIKNTFSNMIKIIW